MADKSNRIEVDLQVMKDEAIDKLEKFGVDFNNSVDRLTKLLEASVDKLGPASAQAGAPSSNASTPTQVAQTMQGVTRARLGGAGTSTGSFSGGGIFANTPGGGDGGGDGGGGYDEGGPSNSSNPGTFEEQITRVQRRIMGDEVAIPSSLRQALGYFSEGGLNLNLLAPLKASVDANGDPIPSLPDVWRDPTLSRQQKLQKTAGRANDVLFNIQASKALAMRGMNKYASFGSGLQGITDSGYQTAPNTGTGGILGTPLFSGSFWHSLNESIWQPLRGSTFGLDLGYSLGQAQHAQQVINSYGWSSGNMGNWLSAVLKENQKNYRLAPETQMAFLDPMLRWGGWQSFDQLEATLRSLPSAAQAAGMNLNQFTQELTQTAQQVAQATGNTPGTVASVLSDFSATTGLAPQQGANLMTTQNILMASAYTGKDPWKIYTGRSQGALMAVPLMRFQQMLGMPVNSFLKLATGSKKDQQTFGQRMFYMSMLAERDPQIFGGMSPLQLINIIKHNGGTVNDVMRHMQVEGEIQHASGHTRAQERMNIEHLIEHFSPGEAGRKMEETFAKKTAGLHMHSGDMKALAEQIVRGKLHDRQVRAARKIIIELSGDAKKYFALQGDAGHVNSGGVGGYARSALHIAEDLGRDGLESATGAVGTAGDYIAGLFG